MSLFPKHISQAAHTVPVAPVAPAVAGTDIIALSKALTTPAPIAVPGMVRPYLAHQGAAHVAANGAIARFGAALLGDDMGMGKTQVLFGLVAERITNGGYAIMLAPPVAKAGYQGDLIAAFPHLRFAHLQGRTPDFGAMPVADIYFISDDSLTMQAWLTTSVVEHRGGKDVKVLHANAFARGAAIITRDELHRDKGNKGKPTGRAKVMAAIGTAARANSIPMVGATGTLLTNRVVEAFLPLQALGGEALMLAITPGANKASGFLWRYCNPIEKFIGGRKVTDFGTDFARLPELHDALRRTVYIRREKADLGDALPHSGWIIKPLALNGVLRRYEQIERDVLAVVKAEKGPEAYMRAARAEKLVQVMSMWAEAGAAKAAAAVEYITDLVDQGRKVVAFYYHDPVQEGLLTGLAKANVEYTVISGAVTGDARIRAIEDFQNGTAQVMVAQIKAAGMAVTLTAAADAVFVQVPWSAGDLKQAADRILRVDDRTMERARNGEAITWHVLQAAHADGSPTFDMAMWGVLEMKAQVCDAVNAGRAITMSDENVITEALVAWYPQASARY